MFSSGSRKSCHFLAIFAKDLTSVVWPAVCFEFHLLVLQRSQVSMFFSFVLQVQVRWWELHFSVDFCPTVAPTHCFHKSIVLWEINLVFYLTNLLALPIFFHLHVFANLFCRKKYLPTIIFHIPHALV